MSKDVFAIGGAISVIVVLFLWVGLVWWALFIAAVGVILGITEYCLWKSGKGTLSEQFWFFKERHPTLGWILLALLAALFLFLLVHLGGVSLESNPLGNAVTEPVTVP